MTPPTIHTLHNLNHPIALCVAQLQGVASTAEQLRFAARVAISGLTEQACPVIRGELDSHLALMTRTIDAIQSAIETLNGVKEAQ